jgi:flagellar basal-body rod modification protein FlgD
MDSADFSAQLAQFSSLEQLTQINDKLSNLTQTQQPAQSYDPVTLLGRDVTAPGSTVDVKNGSDSKLEYTLAAAGKVSVEVRDASGQLVSTAQLGDLAAGDHELDLHAIPAFANLADGTYDVSVDVQSGSGTPTAVDTRISGTVTSVDLQSNPPTVKIGDLSIPIGDVHDVSAAGAA